MKWRHFAYSIIPIELDADGFVMPSTLVTTINNILSNSPLYELLTKLKDSDFDIISNM